MVNLKLQKRLASSILKCGKRRVWLDPNEAIEISKSNSRSSLNNHIKCGLIIKKPTSISSRSRARRNAEAKSKGRHSGYGKRRGTREARVSTKSMWIQHMRILRHLLRKYRNNKKIDKHLYHSLYMKCKGNLYKNKRVLIQEIHREKSEKARDEAIDGQFGARDAKLKSMRGRMARVRK
jgi:large subunit ribosomal protein L19e